MINLPEDIRDYDEDQFVLGASADDEDEDERELDIDDVFAKDLETVLNDMLAYHGSKALDPESFDDRRPSDVDPSLSFVSHDLYGTFLLDDEDRIIGGFIETDLVLADEYQGQGLGREIVVEHFMSNGALPTWYLDSAQYSQAGYNTCCSAHRFPREGKAVYIEKLVRRTVMDNPILDNDDDRARLADLYAGGSATKVRSEIESLMAERSPRP